MIFYLNMCSTARYTESNIQCTYYRETKEPNIHIHCSYVFFFYIQTGLQGAPGEVGKEGAQGPAGATGERGPTGPAVGFFFFHFKRIPEG